MTDHLSLTPKHLWLASGLLACAGLAYLASTDHSSEEVLAQARQIAELRQQLDAAHTKNQQLEQALRTRQHTPIPSASALSSAQTAQTPAAALPTSSAGTNNQAALLAQLQEERQRRKNDEYDFWLKDALQKGATPGATMQARFEQEAIDHQWAPAQEQKIMDLFATRDELRGAALKTTQCRSSQCAIFLAVSSTEQSFEQFEKISSALRQQSPDNFVTFATNMETNTATLYLATEEQEVKRP